MGKLREKLKKIWVLNNLTIGILILSVCVLLIAVAFFLQSLSEQTSLPPITATGSKEQFEIAKLAAEIRQIRSDTTGSLFWLKMTAIFVSVGGAVGGYLVGQNRVTKKRIEFENRKNIESVYQTIVQELSEQAPLLRASAAVKLGNILKSFPAEWIADDPKDKNWKQQQVQLTKQVLAASLAIEQDRKVLKTLTIALVLHKRWEEEAKEAIGRSPAILYANIPFAFAAGDKTFPSGCYAVNAIPSGSDALTIMDRNGKIVKVLSADSNKIKDSEALKIAKLVFHRYGKSHFLSQVWPAGKAEYRQFPKSTQEVSLETSQSPISPIDLNVEIIDQRPYGDARDLDLSGAKAADAFWASTDFSYADFYRADLRGASFRRSVLNTAQFRDANLRNAVFIDANCAGAVFLFADLSEANLSNADLRKADLRHSDLTGAILQKTRFEGARVYKCKLTGAEKVDVDHLDDKVDDSEDGDETNMITIREWLKRETGLKVSS
jgi:hypothetical protein